MKKGTRVRDLDGFFGKGVIVKEIKELDGYYMVQWDKNPPKAYNGGKNPCIVNEEDLKRIKKKKLT